jgi:drug/metabolite transporter (DMT)-like permease
VPLSSRSQIVTGVGLALLAAAAFGVTIPLVAWAGRGVGPLVTAAHLYLGAAAVALAQRLLVREAGAPLTRAHVLPLAVMALAGAAIAPSLLAWGLQRTDSVSGALLLNAEVAWTVVLARLVHREPLGRRALAAVVAMTLASAVLAWRPDSTGVRSGAGMVAVLAAMLAWAVDNTASRRLAEARPTTVVALKGLLGAALTVTLALIVGEQRPEGWRSGALLAAGATGYGASLRLYLLAQRRMGAARTASVFSIAPFLGAVIGALWRPDAFSWLLLGAAALFALGVWLHAGERHEHHHHHHAEEHEHPHRHDDGHHDHHHDEAVVGEHSHPHRHQARAHAHEHGSDVHHGHSH